MPTEQYSYPFWYCCRWSQEKEKSALLQVHQQIQKHDIYCTEKGIQSPAYAYAKHACTNLPEWCKQKEAEGR